MSRRHLIFAGASGSPLPARRGRKARKSGQAISLLLLLIFSFVSPQMAHADFLADIWPNPVYPFDGDTLFPNWAMAPTAAFQLHEFCDCDLDIEKCPYTGVGYCEESRIVSLTVMNYGTASGGPGGDILNLYFRLFCGGVVPGAVTYTMTYAGIWSSGIEQFPAWTWAENPGAGDEIVLNGDPCGDGGEPGCGDPTYGGYMDLFFYTDIAPCPTNNATVALGPTFDEFSLDPADQGGIRSKCTAPSIFDQSVPAVPKMADRLVKSLRYVKKQVDKNVAAPGDTITYRLYYGTPGTGILSSLVLFDSIPDYMHALANNLPLLDNINPAPDPEYGPDPGPPARLRWTESGLIDPTGGRTREVMFRTTMDWGNGESFEPGSGDEGAPEGEFLFNQAHLSWVPTESGCPAGAVSNSVSTVVKRYLFWMLGDQDILFASKAGSEDDSIIYEIFMKNLSATKTWWNVRIWDTVPDLLNVWLPGNGFDDPLVGWTMTPTLAAPGSPGRSVDGPVTLLTWTTNIGPGATALLKFKGTLKKSAEPEDTVFNPAMMMALGEPGQFSGTGSAQKPRLFVHESTVVLRTIFISYVAYAAALNWSTDIDYHAYFISFYPLNRATSFTLYRKWCCGYGTVPYCDNSCWRLPFDGGVSPRINDFAGTCDGGPVSDWETGCLAERAPARYVPYEFADGEWPEIPFNFMHKLVSNAPVIWELATCLTDPSADADAHTGTTSLNFVGYTTYTWLRRDTDTYNPAIEDAMHIVNTDEDNPTTIFVFAWNNGAWQYLRDVDVYKGSMWSFLPFLPDLSPWGKHYRFVSSATKIIGHKAIVGIGEKGSYNDLGTLGVCKETGNLVNSSVPATFYLFSGHLPGADAVAIVGNVGTQNATYDIYRYVPADPLAPNPNVANVSPDLVGTAGTWEQVAANHVAEAAFNPGSVLPLHPNPHIYGDQYDTSTFRTCYRLYKVVLKSGGPVQTYMGRNIVDMWSGGSMLHPSAPEPGKQTGQQYWLHAHDTNTDPNRFDVQALSVFCPQTEQTVRCESSEGYNSAYSTDSIDQCIVFMRITTPAPGARVNWLITSETGGDVISQYNAVQSGEKFYTAPFMRRGTYYDLIAPPIVFVGQPAWVTIVVMNAAGGTKSDYCGTTIFSSTDPAASIEMTPMGAFTYPWDSDLSAATCCCACSGPCDNGVRIFLQVVFNTPGVQSIIAADNADGSITGMAAMQVIAVNIKFFKEPIGATYASGDTVTFRICWSNYSSGSASGFTITDAVPNGMTYLDNTALSEHLCGATYGLEDATVAYSTTDNQPGSFNTLPSAGSTGVKWLRWTIPEIAPMTSGCVCFKALVN